MAPRSDSPLRALSNRNYRVYFFGQLLSMSGTWMQSVAQSWLVYRLSGSGYWLGVVNFAIHMTAFVFSPMAGVVADQVDRRKILLAVQVVAAAQSVLLAGLVLADAIDLWHVVALAVVLGAVNAFDLTTRHAFAVDMVGKADLAGAIVLNSIVLNVSRVLGPVLAGFLIGVIGEGWCFVINGFTYLPVIAGLWHMKTHRTRPVDAFNERGFARGVVKRMAEGLKYSSRHGLILRLLVISTGVCLIASPFVVLLPVFAEKVLGGNANTLAVLTGALGVGAVIGAWLSSQSFDLTEIRRQLVRYVVLWGAGLMVMGWSRHQALSVAAMGLIGFSMMNVFPILNNSIQRLVPDSMRGRVMALYTMTFLGTMPFGSLALGWLSDHAGAAPVTLTTGVLTALIGLSLAFEVFWRSDRLETISSPQAS